MKQRVGSILIFIAQMTLITNLYSQEVEHNYKVGPQQTTCDSITLDSYHLEEAIEKLRSTKFRFQQNFKLTRKQGFKGGEYYSCDNKTGFLIIKQDDLQILYENVKRKVWDELISSSDPEGYYLKKRDKLFPFERP